MAVTLLAFGLVLTYGVWFNLEPLQNFVVGISISFIIFSLVSIAVEVHVTVDYVSLRYAILANHYLTCYLGIRIFDQDEGTSL